MKKKNIISIILAATLLFGASSAFAASAGSAEDPLISLAYATGTYINSVMAKARTMVSDALDALSKKQGSGETTNASFSVTAGSEMAMKTGSSLTLTFGSAELRIVSGAVVNVTAGAEATDGRLLPNNRYLACEDTVAVVSFTSGSVVSARGDFAIEGAVNQFSDVTPDKWFFSDVVTATERGLINGKTAATYEPYSELTVAEAVKLAACLSQLKADGAVTLQNSSGTPWYRSYVDYALEKGIISGEYPDYNSAITREEFVHIFYSAYPASEYKAKNSVADGAIPDIAAEDKYAAEIYAFYRAGILTGDATNHFNPKTAIVRSEVAAVLTRMYVEDARQTVTLP